MSREYRQFLEENYEQTIKNLCSDAPSFVKDFSEHMNHGKREITTQAAYIRDVLDFLKHEASILPEMKDKPLNSFSIETVDKLTIQDINEYKNWLFIKRNLSNSSAKKKLAALSAFFKFLCINEYIDSNPMLNFEFPVINKKHIVKLDAELSSRLLAGILANDKYLATSEFGEFVVDIPPAVWVKREQHVLRNFAICYLFLGAGLRVSELCGLDMDDINFRNNSVTVVLKGGDETEVYFSDEVADALKTYIEGVPASPTLFEKFSPVSPVTTWAKTRINDDTEETLRGNYIEFVKKIKKELDIDLNLDSDFEEVKKIVSYFRRQGRNALDPGKKKSPVFLSNRGTRITVRMVEIMIKEMVKTYLPDYEDADIFSPHKLRATCATRILTQTGNLELASTQLNHKGVAVTAAFYAELQKEQRKDKIKNLDVTEW